MITRHFITIVSSGVALTLLASLACGAILNDEEGILFDEAEHDAGSEVYMPTSLTMPEQEARQRIEMPAPGTPISDPGRIAEVPSRSKLENRSSSTAQQDDVREEARAWRLQGDRLVQSNRLHEAARAYWQASRLNHVNAGYLHYFGFALLALGDHAHGRIVYERILERYPDARKVLFNLASAHYGLGDYEQAMRYLNDYFATRPRENPKALFNSGLLHLVSGEHEEAISQLERARERLPVNPFIPAALIKAYRAAGKNKSADLLQAVSEDQFGAETFASLLAIETPPVYLER